MTHIHRTLPRIAARFAVLAAVAVASLFGGGEARAAAAASLVVEADTGRVLHAEAAVVPMYPASLTKMMTIYLVLEAVEQKKISLDDRWTVSAFAAGQSPTKLGLHAGQTIAVKEAVLSLITRSANDSAVVAAEALAGGEAAFARRMTETAHRLGMSGTRFVNASGLPAPNQSTNAHDMAVLARALLHDFPKHWHFFNSRTLTWAGETLPTYNGILGAYAGADGIKTGFTCDAGYNLVATAVRGGQRVIGVILGGASRVERTAEMARLLDLGFQRAGHVAGLKLDELPAPPAGLNPLSRLTAGACAAVARAMGPGSEAMAFLSLTPAALKPGSWGIELGRYADQAVARSTATQALSRLGPLGKGARPATAPHRGGGLLLSRALIVNMSRDAAIQACQRIEEGGHACLTVNPGALDWVASDNVKHPGPATSPAKPSKKPPATSR